jgi:hypothetical protein
MDIFDSIAHIARGAAESGLRHQYKTDPKLRRKLQQQAKASAERCTPCAAGSWLEGARQKFGMKR